MNFSHDGRGVGVTSTHTAQDRTNGTFDVDRDTERLQRDVLEKPPMGRVISVVSSTRHTKGRSGTASGT